MITTIFKEDGLITKALNVVHNLKEEIRDFAPDLVLMDILLEDADGRNLCNEIKSEFNDLPVVLMTAALLHTIKEIPCQPDAIVTKPFDIFELSKKISQLLA